MDLPKKLPEWTETIKQSPQKRYGILCVGSLLFIIGIILCCLPSASEKMLCSNAIPSIPSEYTIIIDYTYCTDLTSSISMRSCYDSLKKNPKSQCACLLQFNLTNDLVGDVIMYYELTDLHEYFNSEFINSRDNAQLNGVLSNDPKDVAKECSLGNNTVKQVPNLAGSSDFVIAPCGAMADAMFNDTYELRETWNYDEVPNIKTGIIRNEDKVGFRNPPLHGETLNKAFKNNTNPKSWTKNIWELSDIATNNGFENEQFIAWMHGDWVRKPIWRLNRSKPGFENGLKKAKYILVIDYTYPLKLYSGKRKVVISSCNIHEKVPSTQTELVIGVILIILSLFFLIPSAVIVYLAWKQSIKLEDPGDNLNNAATLEASENEKLNDEDPKDLPLNVNNTATVTLNG